MDYFLHHLQQIQSNPIYLWHKENNKYKHVHKHKVPTGHQGRDSPALTGALKGKKRNIMA